MRSEVAPGFWTGMAAILGVTVAIWLVGLVLAPPASAAHCPGDDPLSTHEGTEPCVVVCEDGSAVGHASTWDAVYEPCSPGWARTVDAGTDRVTPVYDPSTAEVLGSLRVIMTVGFSVLVLIGFAQLFSSYGTGRA